MIINHELDLKHNSLYVVKLVKIKPLGFVNTKDNVELAKKR